MMGPEHFVFVVRAQKMTVQASVLAVDAIYIEAFARKR